VEAASTGAFISLCESLKSHAEIVIKDLNTLDTNYLKVEDGMYSRQKQDRISMEIEDSNEQARALLASYENARTTGKKLGIELPEIDAKRNPRAFLREVMVALDTGIGFVGSSRSPLSPEEQDKLASLKKQIKPIEDWNLGIYKHLTKAIEEQEAAHYLSAAMIAAKVSMYVHEQLDGSNETEKTKKLVEKGLLPAKLQEGFLTGTRLARHYYIHETLEIPEPQESMNIVSFSVDLALRYQRSKATPSANPLPSTNG
jgi:hypothetical protein